MRITGLANAAVALLLTLGSSACATIPPQVQRTARADLDCPNVTVEKLGEGRYGAYGCGRGAVYAELCEPGAACRLGRLRHGHEAQVGAVVTSGAEGAPREVLPAPAPQPREVIPAPDQAPRQIIAAPPPGSGEGDASPPPSQGEPSDPKAPAEDGAPAPAPVPLSDGDLSDPYQADVPATPVAQRVEQAPPEPLVEDLPPRPAFGYTWVNGYWWWAHSGRWVWVPGYWCEPVVGYTYLPGYWYWSFGYWSYWPGGWGYPGTTVIVQRVAPRPRTVVTVRSFTSRRSPPRATPSTRVVSASPRDAPTGFRPRPSPLLRYPTPRRATPVSEASQSRVGAGRSVRPGPGAPGRAAPGARVRPGSVGRVVRPSPRTVTSVRAAGRSRAGYRPSVSRSSVPRSYHMRSAPPPASRPAPSRGVVPARRR